MSASNADPPLPLYSIALLSAATLAYEVLLIRLLSIIQWHHFAYMVISLALLGYGASGAFLMIARERLERNFPASFLTNLIAFGAASLLCYLIAQRIPFHPEEMLWNVRQLLRLPLVYLLLGLPFFFTANAIGLTLSRYPDFASRTYAADLIGAGSGSIAIIGLLYVTFPSTALRIISVAGFLAALVALRELHRTLTPGVLAIVPAAAFVLLMPGQWSELAVSPYKPLPQLLQISGTTIRDVRSSPLGVLTVVESTATPLRHAPGLSLNATAEPPPQLAVFTDADSMTAITRFRDDRTTVAYLDQMTSALPYHLKSITRVLILGAGGGNDVLRARYHNAGRIVAVELNSQLVGLMRGKFADFSGRLYDHPSTHVYQGEARGFVRTHTDQYDLIATAVPGSFGASATGLYALNENYLFTVEALQDYIKRLAPDGFVVITAWIKMPPRDTLKLFATAVEALRKSNAADPERRLILIRGWQTSTLLIKNGVLTEDEIARMKAFCRSRSFDTAYYPDMKAGEGNEYNVLREQPSLFHDAAVALLGEKRNEFLHDYKFQLQPATDDQPYFFHFFKWRTLPEILRSYRQGGASLLESGYPLLVAAMIQAIGFSFVLILLPLLLHRKKKHTEGRTPWRIFSYFFALGLAFLFIEIAFIQKFMLYLYHPVFAVSATLTSFLLFAGLGSAYSKRWMARSGSAATVKLAVGAIVILGMIYIVALGKIFEALSWVPGAAKILISVCLIAIPAFFMGMPFPVGLQVLSNRSPQWIPWAWGVNGCASVLSAIAATLIAIDFGFTRLVILAFLLYGAAALLLPDPFKRAS